MKKFEASQLFIDIAGLANAGQCVPQGNNLAMPMQNYRDIKIKIDNVCSKLPDIGLQTSLISAIKLRSIIDTEVKLEMKTLPGLGSSFPSVALFEPLTIMRYTHLSNELLQRFSDELSQKLLFILSPVDADLLEPTEPLFGSSVEAKFPSMSEDISEAGKCLALERPTASVFHLMRVMEIGVQRFGDKLGVSLTTEKNWQNILDETHKAIKALDQKAPQTKTYAKAAAHLYNVKLGWRNEVMHPKQTYTTSEGNAIFGAVRTFIIDLASLI